MEASPIIFSYNFGRFTFDITTSVIVQWFVILVLGIGSYLLTRNLKMKPGKAQAALEKIYQTIYDLVENVMGSAYVSFIPYVGTLMIYLLILNFFGLIGIKPPTQDLSVTTAFAVISFLVVNGYAIKKNGIAEFGKSFVHPFAPMLPINIMEKIVLPVSLALRLFGNMLAATYVLDLLYTVLRKISVFAQIGLPVFAHLYFDIFDGTIQMLVFSMLTMIYIKVTAEE
ncbi:F0F1 ATP synthase subunit A [Clostridium sp. SM-530-WT-3G]|uniref:F0F1 ATP synthase subunit A n=1 Tax=Clostridium sp. SM-530-WT-3G TaxID=2725303 RepID=UPI00145D1C3B|nr:F0F1 ATP synthase subunit A [Clostridium sp. SM-530-WT-3G]